MMTDLQKAGMWKRISAFILDFILLCVVASGFALAVSAVAGYDSASDALYARYEYFQKEYDVDLKITEEEYTKLPEEEKEKYDIAYKAISDDTETMQAYSRVVNLTLLITSLGIFLAVLALEFIVPLFLKNGQTLGKKIFAVCLMRTGGIRITPAALFVRSLLGKYALEIMVPVLVFLMIIFNGIGFIGLAVLGLIAVLQVALLLFTANNSLIHDLLAGTVAVDASSQMIFETAEERDEYIRKEAAERAAREKH